MVKKWFAVFVCFCLVAAPITGCGKVQEEIDPNKTQIYVSVYSSGYGTDWLKEIKRQFEADYKEYQVIITPTNDGDLYSGASMLNYNVYFTTNNYAFKELTGKNLFADLSDVYDNPAGNETRPVKEKVQDYETMKQAFSYPGKSGIYALPFTKSVAGFVYDHGIFKENLENGWLWPAENSSEVKSALTAQGIAFREEGSSLRFVSGTGTNYAPDDVILRAGKDGVYGTYDDGQPQTLAEWKQMLALIKLDPKGSRPVTFSDSNGYVYTLPVLEAMLAQYEGLDNYRLFNTYEGVYERPGADAVTVRPDEGYKVYDMEGIDKSFQFYYDNICNPDNLAVNKDSDHRGAQEKFLLWDYRTSANPGAAMLVEGIWWENEARTTFESMSEQYAYGTRDYRYMLLPELPGQLGIDGQGNGTVFAAQESGLTLVANKGSADVIAMSKKFVEYTLTDENLRNFTAQTGVARPYKYEMTEAQLAGMTKFQRNVLQLMQDVDNVRIVSPVIDAYCAPVAYTSELGAYRFRTSVQEAAGKATYSYPIEMRSRVADVSVYLAGMRSYYREQWAGFYRNAEGLYQ